MWHQQQQQQQAYLSGMPSQHPQQQTIHPVSVINTNDHSHQQQQHQHYQHYHQHQHRSTIMDLPVSSNPRASRNMAEKQRRDNLNTNISTMAALVPIVAGSSRRMDKISILRLAAAFLRTQYTLGSGSKTRDFLPPQFDDFDLEQYFVDHIVDSSGFFLVVTTTGKIVYVSRQVEQHLGHVQNEMLGQSLYSFVYPEDHDELTRNLSPEDTQSATGNVAQISELAHDSSSSSSEDSTTNHKPNERLKSFREQRRNFTIRLAQRTVSKRNTTQYECFDVSGVLRLADACKNADLNGNKGKYRETSTSNDIVFTGIATLPKKRPITELSILDINKDEYVTRHLVDGRIIFCDHRISLIAGYMSEEVSGENAFKFMHKDDFRWTMIGLRQMYDRAETYGSSCYRLFTKNGGFIYLRTHGYLEFDKDTQTVESFVCVNTLVSENEGIKLMREMKERFSAIVTPTSRSLIPNLDSTPTDLDSGVSSCPESNLETRQKIEDAINHLISDLPSPAMSEDRFSPSPMPDTQFVKAAIFSSRMPPAATQASRIGIKKIDRYVLNGKRNRTLSQDSNDHTMNKLFSPSSAEQSPISDTESAKVSGKNLTMLGMKNTRAHNSTPGDIRGGTQSSAGTPLRSSVLAANTSPCVSCNPASCRNAPQAANVLKQERMEQQCSVNMVSPGSVQKSAIRMEHNPETFSNRSIKQEPPALQYFDDNTSDSSVVSSGLISPVETPNRGPLKRICIEDDVTATHSKRRPNDVYASTNGTGEQQSASYLKCKIYATENKYPAFSAGLRQYNDISSQPLLIESPNSGLHDAAADNNYQHLADPLITMHPDDEQFDDVLLSPELKNPELMMKIFDNLRTEPVPNLNYESFNEAKVQQLLSDDQAVNDQIRRTYDQLADSMAYRESQINGLKHELEHKLLSAQRENLSQLQAEHNMQKQMLRNLQQDHRKMQLNTKHTHGV